MNKNDGLKPLIALVKAYRGGEWFLAALESVRQQCTGAVVVTSDGPWREVAGQQHLPENCREPLAAFRRRHPDFLVREVRPPARQSTDEQYKAGMLEIQKAFGGAVGVLLLDTDEVWQDDALLRLREAMTSNSQALVFRSGIWSYLRSPLWRVAPQEKARVVVGLARPGLATGKSRLADLQRLYLSTQIADVLDCSFHHFGYVRNDPDVEIVSKLTHSTSQDRVPVPDDWKQRVWDRLPQGRDIHPQKGFERCWGGVEEIDASTLPDVATDSGAFVSGMLWHGESNMPPHNLFVADCPTWRGRVESMTPEQCPATVVQPSLVPALRRFLFRLTSGWTALADFLQPRLRTSLRETVQLAALATEVPVNGTALEIGSGKGGSMAVLMLACPPGTRLLAVDPYLSYDEENVNLDRAVREGSVLEFREVVARVGGARLPTLAEQPSREAVRDVTDASLDLLLVDGNHSYAYCKEDLELWWPKVKAGGLVMVHDYATRFPGVIRAVKEFETERGVRFALPLGSTLAWLRKP